jgi:flagellar motor switch protein FliN/FliY
MANETDTPTAAGASGDSDAFEPVGAGGSAEFRSAEFSGGNNAQGKGSIQESHMEVILDVPVTLAVEVGRTMMSIRDLLQLSPGSVVKLHRPAGDPMDIRVNGCRVARGEVVVVSGQFGIRITDVISPEDRVRTLK